MRFTASRAPSRWRRRPSATAATRSGSAAAAAMRASSAGERYASVAGIVFVIALVAETVLLAGRPGRKDSSFPRVTVGAFAARVLTHAC